LDVAVDNKTAFLTMDCVSLVYRGLKEEDEGTLALRNLNLEVERGDFVAVVGPSGCGKSTLLKAATGLVRTSSGKVLVDGTMVTGPLKIVGMAFQNPILLPWRKLLQNVMLPLEIVEPHRRRLSRDRDIYVAKAKELLSSVGLSGFEEKHPWELSGGMQQRASLCRALIHEPKMLMLDEPFGALDAFTREELWGILQQLWMNRRFTVVLVTHDLREAVFLANTVHVMSSRPGKILSSVHIPMPYPRTLDDTFTPEFGHIVHNLRTDISREQTQ
jgi:NitT/TauT family transport system ATP-binding protein